MARVARKALRKARISGHPGSSSAKVAPVTNMPSPSEMMMNRAQRSAMWAPLIVHSSALERPRPGTAKKVCGPLYSMASAAAHQASRRAGSSSSPPAIHKGEASAK